MVLIRRYNTVYGKCTLYRLVYEKNNMQQCTINDEDTDSDSDPDPEQGFDDHK
jgi:hypothetical protein